MNAIQNIVVIYAANRMASSNMFGNFPSAHGLGGGAGRWSAPLRRPPTFSYGDRDGTTPLTKLPKTWGGVTLAGNLSVVTEAQSDNLANAPFSIENA